MIIIGLLIELLKKSFPVSGSGKIEYFKKSFPGCGDIEFFKKVFPGCTEIEFFKKSFLGCREIEFKKNVSCVERLNISNKHFRVQRD